MTGMEELGEASDAFEAAVNRLGDLAESWAEKRDALYAALKDAADLEPDDFAVQVCEALDIPCVPPTFESREVDPFVCLVCSAFVADEQEHAKWHVRLQAYTKVSGRMGELGLQGADLLGAMLKLQAEAEMADGDGQS